VNNSKSILVDLNEHRVELEDARLNLIGFADSKSLSFLNAENSVFEVEKGMLS